MAPNNKSSKIGFLSPFPPRESGMATFTQDLVAAIDSFNIVETKIIAIDGGLTLEYGDKVIAVISEDSREDYSRVAVELNDMDLDLVVIEYKQGLFGGDENEYILDFVEHLQVPMMTTLHSLNSVPNEKQRYVMTRICDKSDKVICMAENTKALLSDGYGVNSQKIEVIHHGVTKKHFQSRDQLKQQYDYEDKLIVTTFGLIGPGKGIELGIEAISKVVPNHENILYLILGENHPGLESEALEYRDNLEGLVRELNLEKNVVFINKYLTNDQIMDYLQLSDIYMSPNTEVDQAVSGTLAYAMGYGRAIVSTPFSYAKEMLAGGRGMLAEFDNADSIANCIIEIIDQPEKKAKMEKTTLRIGRTMYWYQIGKNYIKAFLNIPMR